MMVSGDAFEQEAVAEDVTCGKTVAPTIRTLGTKLLQRAERTPVELSEAELRAEIDRLDAEITRTDVANPRWNELVERVQALHEELTHRIGVSYIGVPLPERPSGVELDIVSPRRGELDVLYIDTTPRMPEFQARIRGIEPDPTPSSSFTWQLDVVETVRPDTCASAGIGECREDPSGERVIGGRWRPDTIQGGNAMLWVDARVHGERLTAYVDDFLILGRNPAMAAVTARAGGARSIGDRIAIAESGRQQFRDGMPDFGRTGDVGVMQLCNPPATCPQRWD